jgi:hypothetical protein
LLSADCKQHESHGCQRRRSINVTKIIAASVAAQSAIGFASDFSDV